METQRHGVLKGMTKKGCKMIKAILVFSLIFVVFVLLGCDVKMSPIESEDLAKKFAGDWKNENPDTDNITQVKIEVNSETISIQEWGNCEPVACDWGVNTVNVSEADDEVLFLTWDQGFAILTQEISLTNQRKLKVSTHNKFVDNSGRVDFDRTELFVKK
jgi:hypothetical protein